MPVERRNDARAAGLNSPVYPLSELFGRPDTSLK